MKIIGNIAVTLLVVFVLLGMYILGIKYGTESFMESPEFTNNYIDMREVIDFEATETGLYLYTEDGSGYYLGE